MKFFLGNTLLYLEILIGGLIFTYKAPKRDFFWLKFILLNVAFFTFIFFSKYIFNDIPAYYFYLLRDYLITIFLIITTFVSFKLTLLKSICLIIESTGIQKIGYTLTLLLSSSDFLKDFSLPFLSRSHFFEIIFYAMVASVLFFIVKTLIKDETYYISKFVRYDIIIAVIIIIGTTISSLTYILKDFGSKTSLYYSLFSNITAFVFYFLIYRILTIGNEKQLLQGMISESTKQYEIRKETIEAINIKCHDLRHRLNHLPIDEHESQEIKSLIHIYDQSVKTGNEVVDTVLMDYLLRNTKNKINYLFHGNAACLSFVKTSDLYSLFGNALENATRSTLLVEESKRTIDIKIETFGSMIAISVQNPYVGTIEFKNDLPVSTKDDKTNHGFGTKSMKLIAQKYHGAMKISTENQIYSLTVTLLNPDPKDE